MISYMFNLLHTHSVNCWHPSRMEKTLLLHKQWTKFSSIQEAKDSWRILVRYKYGNVKTLPDIWSLVHTTAYLTTSLVRLSGNIRQLINPSWRRNVIPKRILSFPHARTSCVHPNWMPKDTPRLLDGIWDKLLNLVQICLLILENGNVPKYPVPFYDLFKGWTLPSCDKQN